MEFQTPTTKAQMFEILEQLYYEYRVKKPIFEELELKEIELPRLEYVMPTNEQITERANAILMGELQREKQSKRAEYMLQIDNLNKKIELSNASEISLIEKVNEDYEKSKENVLRQAEKNGLINSAICVDKIAFLENEKNQKISDIRSQKEQELNGYRAEVLSVNTKLNQIDSQFEQLQEMDVQGKVDELTFKCQAIERDVFKYNNGLEEKEQRYRNTIMQANANIRLKYMEINSGDLSKEQLIDNGYYSGVLRCVTGYYDTLDAEIAYQDFCSEEKLMIYLEDYYSNVLYLYSVRAGL